MTTWYTLRSKKEYKKALKRIDDLIDAPKTDHEQNELTLLSYLVEDYEESVYTIPDASPHEVIRFIMEMKGLKQKDLIPILGSKGHVSKILHGKRNLTLDKIAEISSFLDIPMDALIPKANIKKITAKEGA